MTNSSSSQGFNLLQIRPVWVLIQWPLYPYIFQIIALVVFVTLAIIGWGHFVPECVNDKLYAKDQYRKLSHLGTLVANDGVGSRAVWSVYYIRI